MRGALLPTRERAKGNNLLRIARVLILMGFGWWSVVGVALAAELRVLDASGLVRAVKVVRGNARVVIKIKNDKEVVSGECVASNVDGLASEKRAIVSAQGECAFNDMAVGSWQITVPGKAKWHAIVYE